MLRDTEFFKSRISKIDGAGDIGDYLFNIVNAKAVAAQPKLSQETSDNTNQSAEKQQEADGEERKWDTAPVISICTPHFPSEPYWHGLSTNTTSFLWL